MVQEKDGGAGLGWRLGVHRREGLGGVLRRERGQSLLVGEMQGDSGRPGERPCFWLETGTTTHPEEDRRRQKDQATGCWGPGTGGA